jgi:hypothetical protein
LLIKSNNLEYEGQESSYAVTGFPVRTIRPMLSW